MKTNGRVAEFCQKTNKTEQLFEMEKKCINLSLYDKPIQKYICIHIALRIQRRQNKAGIQQGIHCDRLYSNDIRI